MIDFSIAFAFLKNLFYSVLHLGFPNEPAAIIALSTIKEWLAKNQHQVGEKHNQWAYKMLEFDSQFRKGRYIYSINSKFT